jgi:hypothetical protein
MGFQSDGSSFFGLFTRGEISHIRIWSAVGRIGNQQLFGSPSSVSPKQKHAAVQHVGVAFAPRGIGYSVLLFVCSRLFS